MPVARRLFRNLSDGMRTYWQGSMLEFLPLRHSLRGYRRGDLAADVRAGTNVALLALPQGMAYAVIAEIPIAYGITCAAVAALVAPFFAGSRFTMLGPTNATAFMIFSSFAAHPSLPKLELLPVLVFMMGLMLVVGAMFRLADLVQYISRSVVVGYLTGAAILIIGNQLRHVLGVELEPIEGSKNFFTIVAATLGSAGDARWPPALLAAATAGLWLLLTRRFRWLPTFAITLVIMSAAGAALIGRGVELDTFEPFTSRSLRPVLPDVTRPEFIGQVGQLFGVAFAVAFLSSLENSVMAKTLASRSGDRPRVNQDMLSVGVTNLVASVLSGMPASGSLTRSALNAESGARTQVSSLVCGMLCAAGAFTLGPLVAFVPKASLAALVVCIAGSLINRRHLRICLSATRSDAVTLVATFLATLLMPLHVAIFVGVGVSIALYLRKASRPQLVEYEFDTQGQLRERERPGYRQNPSISIVHVEGALFFGAAELFRTQIQRTCNDPNLRVIILRMKNAYHLDATSVMALEELIRFLRETGRHLIISGAMKDVYRVLRNSGLVELLGRENLFMGSPSNPNISTRNALKRAQELLGTSKADVRIWYDPSRPRE